MDKTYLSKEDLNEGQELIRLTRSFQLLANLIETNTLLVPEGQEEAKKYHAIATLLQNQQNQFLAEAVKRTGISIDGEAHVNFETGEITPVEPK